MLIYFCFSKIYNKSKPLSSIKVFFLSFFLIQSTKNFVFVQFQQQLVYESISVKEIKFDNLNVFLYNKRFLNSKLFLSLSLSTLANRKTIKGLIIAAGLMCFVILTRSNTITSYAVYIPGKTVTTLNPHQSSVAIAVMLLIRNLYTTALAELLGRKTLLIISLLGYATGQTANVFEFEQKSI